MSNQHYLKTLPEYFNAVENGTKPFEVRKNDRNYQVGDTLRLQEYSNGTYTGRKISKKISYILDDPAFCKDGFVVLGLTADEREMNTQIEEMAIKIHELFSSILSLTESKIIAAAICTDGYHKQSEGEWISVEERLPDEYETVLVYGEEIGVRMAFYAVDKRVWNEGVITHWMPLPEPPKMKGGE